MREPMSPSRIFLGGFLEEYSSSEYPEVESGLFMQHNHLQQDLDLPAAVQVFADDGHVRAIRIHLDGYFIVPLRRVMASPAYVFAVVQRLTYVDTKAPRRIRLRFWLARRLFAIAERILT
jgi:hypothetical protein